MLIPTLTLVVILTLLNLTLTLTDTDTIYHHFSIYWRLVCTLQPLYFFYLYAGCCRQWTIGCCGL